MRRCQILQGRLGRALRILLEGVTLGSLTQPVYRAVTGYVAFFTLVLYMVALALLPHAGVQTDTPGTLEARGTRHPRDPGHEELTRHEARSPRHDW